MMEGLTKDDIYNAARKWCGAEEREDITYFVCNWFAVPALRELVEREVAERVSMRSSER